MVLVLLPLITSINYRDQIYISGGTMLDLLASVAHL